MTLTAEERLEERFVQAYGNADWFHSIAIVRDNGFNFVEVRVNERLEPPISQKELNILFDGMEKIPLFKIVNKPKPIYAWKMELIPTRFFDWQENVGM